MNSLLPKTSDTLPPQMPSDLADKRTLVTSQVIIQCPACQTKFALDQASLSGIEKPKFHCSRCDNVFRPEQGELSPLPSAPATRQLAATRPGRIQPELIVSAPAEQSFETETEDSSPQSFEDLDLDFDDDKSDSENALKPSDFSISSSSYAPNADRSEAVNPKQKVTSRDFIIREPIAEAHLIPPPAGRVMPAELSTIAAAISAPASREKIVPGISVARSIRRIGIRWQGPIVYLVPLMAVMTGLVLLASSARVNPERIGALITAPVPGLFEPLQPVVPPSGLYVKQSELRVVTLQDGNRVPLLIGRVINSTNTAIAGVTVEGIGFDTNARAVISKRVPIRSELAREKPEFLTKETVSRLESLAPQRRQLLEPGETAEFAVVLEGEKGRTPIQYYSARIFSVQ